MEAPYAIITVEQPPIVLVRVVSEPNDVNYPQYLEDLAQAFRGLDKFAMIFNTGGLTQFPAKYRELQSAWLKNTQQEFEGRWIAAAFVIQSRVIRGVLITLFWLNRPYYKHIVLSDERAALDWVTQQLGAAGVSTDSVISP